MPAPPHETAALASTLGHGLSAELLFGIGGGTGFGWFTYGDHSTLLTRMTTRETAKESFAVDVCARLGIEARLTSATNAPALRKRLEAALASGDSALVSVGGPAVSYSWLSVSAVTDEVLERAGGVPGAARNRILVVKPKAVGKTALRSAIQAGLLAQRQQMLEGFGPPSARGSFGLAGFQRWRRAIAGLDETARARVREQIEGRGGGPALRGAQAAFLEEAGEKTAARLTRAAADAWAAAARSATTETVSAIEEAERAALS
jgi:hypothetical protein